MDDETVRLSRSNFPLKQSLIHNDCFILIAFIGFATNDVRNSLPAFIHSKQNSYFVFVFVHLICHNYNEKKKTEKISDQ